ncbi:MAG: hypothetical protein OEY61_03725 [Gammaproteobacteria bacterium]|nr:hypothetical protein [Gammaproteobacteria bacterium]
MKAITTIKYLLALTLISLVAACGSSSTDTRILDTTDSYTVEYIPGATDATQGKTSFQFKVTDKTTNNPITGATASIKPVMVMTDKTHSTPVESVTESSTPGTYNATAYYLMSSSGGVWTLNIIINDETASFVIDVAMDTTAVTTLSALISGSDLVMGSPRKYKLFRESLTGSAGTYSFNFFVAAMETMMSWPAIDIGVLGITSVDVQVSLDASDWISYPVTDNGSGHFTVNDLSLSEGIQDEIYVKLIVNGEVKTTDGADPDGNNDYTTFSVTP